MIDVMLRPRPSHLHHETTRHGKTVWYVRIGDGPRTRIRTPFGSPEFGEEYRAAVEGRAPIAPTRSSATDSLVWLVARYRGSSAWSDLSPATRRQRENIFKHVLATAGDVKFAKITRKVIVEGRERRKATPAQANNFVKAMRSLFKWALDSELVREDPARDVTMLKVKGEGFHPWTEEEVAAFEMRWPVGTRERVAFDVLLYTGLRRGDAVRLGRQHVRDGIFAIKTEKTGVEIVAPILPQLAQSLAAGPTGDLHFIAGVRGRPMAKESFGTWFKQACVAAGFPGSAHGLRKAGARGEQWRHGSTAKGNLRLDRR